MNASSIGILLFQVPVILLVTGLCGELLERLRQPRIVGEILGGLVLGPLVLGRISPGIFAFLFPPLQLKPLEMLASIGLILFLFLVGSELDLGSLLRDRGALPGIIFGSIYLPFAFGASLAPALRAHFADTTTNWLSFMMFIGVAMSVTALPVLANIIDLRKLSPRPVDSTVAARSLLSAAANDLLAWALLAVGLALSTSAAAPVSFLAMLGKLALLLLYIGGMLGIVRPLAKLLLTEGVATWALVIAAIPYAILNAQISHALGVHAFFGAFLAGLCFPVKHAAWMQLERPLRPYVQLMLPVFFALAGLRVESSTLSRSSFVWFVLILAGATIGKFAGAALAARASGMNWRPAAQIGALLNTRGIIELIVLNIGLDERIFDPALYTLFVFMAVVTTAMTTPLLNLLTPAHDANRIWS